MCGVHSGSATLVGGRPAPVAARRGREASAARARGEAATARLGEGNHTPHLLRPVAEHHDSEAAMCHAWQGQRASVAAQRLSHATLGKASNRALKGSTRADTNDRKMNKRI